MTDQQSLEREIHETLDERAPMQSPNHLLHTFEHNARRTNRYPRWLALAKEPPMRANTRLAVGSPFLRIAAMMLATMLVIGATVGAAAGVQRLLAADNEIVVDQSGNGDYTTIQEALDAAKDGTSILVMPGRYGEYLDVTKDVSLSGVGERSTIVLEYDHEGRLGENWGYGVLLSEVEAALSNMEIRGPAGGTAIVARGGSLDLDDILVHPGPAGLRSSAAGSIHNVELYGLILDGASDLTIEDSRLWCRVHVAGTSGIAFNRTEFLLDADSCPEQPDTNDGGLETRDGILYRPDELAPYSFGVRIELASPVFTLGTFEMPVEVHGALVTPVSPRGRLKIHDGAPGLGASPVIEGSSFTGLETAILVLDSAKPRIRDNTFIDNGTAVAVGKSDAVIEGNVVSSGQAGFVLTSVSPELTGNTVDGVAGPAVSITGAASPILRDNVLCAEGEVLSVADTADPDIDESNEVC